MRSLLPELGRRLWSGPAQVRGWRGELCFATELGSATIAVSGGSDEAPRLELVASAGSEANTLRLAQHRLTQLLFGTLSLEIVATDADTTAPADADVFAAMSALFPQGFPWRFDVDYM